MKSPHRNNGHGHITETPDVSHIRNLDVTHELSDVNIRGIMTFIGGLVVMTIFVYLLMWAMFRVLAKREQEQALSPMAMTGKERLPAEPRLQGAPGFAEALEKETGVKEGEKTEGPPKPKDPLWEIRALRQHWDSSLKFGEKDPAGKTLALPIEGAKKELLREGLPVRPNEPIGSGNNDLPTAASSGRVAGGSKQ
jgi:cbb3-type cytochrome oxidase subunit 3